MAKNIFDINEEVTQKASFAISGQISASCNSAAVLARELFKPV